MTPPVRWLALVALTGLCALAQAQLKPTGPGTPPLPETQRVEGHAVKELAARAAAEQWLKLLDAGEYGKAWEQCADLFRERVTKAQWVDGLPKTRGAFGAMKSRRPEVASYKTTLAGAPDGEYVTVRFDTNFEKKERAEELMTLTLEKGSWRPTGYSIR
jgi:hypothetical protein